MRSAAFKRSAACGVAGACGVAYWQRLPRRTSDEQAEWAESTSSRIYRAVIAPAVLCTDPETAHLLTLRVGRALQAVRLLAEPRWTGATPLDWLLRPAASEPDQQGPNVRQALFGGRLVFDSPVGIAAGFDKNADLVPLYRLGAIPGLGFSEVGSVSAQPSDGNPKPRLFRLEQDEAVINRMGLNNVGCEAVAARMEEYSVLGSASSPAPGWSPCAPVGINVAKTHSPDIMGDAAVEDFATSVRTLAPHADFLVLNVSCPNTAEGKTFEDSDSLRQLLGRVATLKSDVAAAEVPGAARWPPVLVKLSPPLDDDSGRAALSTLVAVARDSGVVDGFVISNTAGDREVPLSAVGRHAAEAAGRGGLSGKPLRPRSTAAIREVYRLTDGQMPIIGVGGVDSAESAYEKIRAGASLVEVYSGLVYKGPCLLSDMHTGLRRLLARDGFGSVQDAVGADCHRDRL